MKPINGHWKKKKSSSTRNENAPGWQSNYREDSCNKLLLRGPSITNQKWIQISNGKDQ